MSSSIITVIDISCSSYAKVDHRNEIDRYICITWRIWELQNQISLAERYIEIHLYEDSKVVLYFQC